MSKVAVLILAAPESPDGLGRVLNALEAVKELQSEKDDVKLYFDGAGTKWISALDGAEHPLHGLYASVRPSLAGACAACAGALGVADSIKKCDVPFVGEYDGHPSVRKLIKGGYQVITF